jgi:hypothetical protein
MDINTVAYIKNGIVKNLVSVPVIAPESFYIELLELNESDVYIIATEETGDPFINGEWDGIHFRPVFDTVEENPVLSLMHWSAEARNMVPIKPCPKPGEMFYDPDQDEWFDIVQ